MYTGRRRRPVVTISEVKLKPRPLQRSCGSQTPFVQEIQSDEDVLKEPPAPPPSPPLPDVKNVTVKFHFNKTSVVSQIYNNYATLAEIKLDLSKRFEVKPEILILKQFGCELPNECSIHETIDDELGIYNYNLEVIGEVDSLDQPRLSNYSRKSVAKILDIETYNK